MARGVFVLNHAMDSALPRDDDGAMSRRWSFACLGVIGFIMGSMSACATVAPPAASSHGIEVAYRAALVPGREPAVDITVDLTGAAEGQTTLTTASFWPIDHPEQRFVDVRATDAAGVALPVVAEAPTRWTVRHAPRAALRVHYRLADACSPRAATSKPEFIEPHRCRLVAAATLLFPKHLDDGQARRIGFSWQGFREAGWTVASSFGLGQEVTFTLGRRRFDHSQYFAAPASEVALTSRDLGGGRTLVLALQGQRWKFSPDVITDVIARIDRGVRGFFDRLRPQPAPPFFLVTFVPDGPYNEKQAHFLGSGLTNSFSVKATPPFDYGAYPQVMQMILTHELIHNWFQLTIAPAVADPEVGWFFEGFTTFYTRRLLYKMGFLSRDDVVAELNRVLDRYAGSPARNAPNTRLVEGFFNDRQLGDMPYLRGDLIALLVDREMRAASGGRRGLDDLTAQLLDRAAGGNTETTRSLLDALTRATSPALGAALASVVIDGQTIELPADVLAPCLRLDDAGPGGARRFRVDRAEACPDRL
jgi:predicted metalloprotease with PDZ domain